MDKEQVTTLNRFGFAIEELPNMKTIPRITLYTKDGRELPNLPADPYHLNRYLARGFTLQPPEYVSKKDTQNLNKEGK